MVRISNLQIIRILLDDARTPYSKIAKSLGVSETAVRKRIKKMEREGVILNYETNVDAKKLGFEINVLIGIDALPQYYMRTIELLKKMKIIRKLYRSSGDHMIMAECWFKDSVHFAAFAKKLERMKGIEKICPAIIIERIK